MQHGIIKICLITFSVSQIFVVGAVGIEPTLPKEQDFKSCVSAISPRALSGNDLCVSPDTYGLIS